MYEKSETAPRRDRIKRLLRIAAALVGLGLLIRLNPFIDLIGLADVWMNRYEGLSAWGFGWRAAVEMFAVGAALLILLRLFGRGSTLPNLRDLLPVLRFFGLGKKASFHASNRRSVKNALIDLIAAPALYAAALQAVPMFVLSRFDAGAGTQLAVSVYLSALFFHRRGSWSWLFWGTQNLYAATAFVYGVGVSWAGAFGLAFALHCVRAWAERALSNAQYGGGGRRKNRRSALEIAVGGCLRRLACVSVERRLVCVGV